MAEFGPDTQWPRHQRKYVAELLEFVRERGWTLRKSGGHSWGEIRCPAGVHSHVIGSTPGNQEAWCKGVRKKIDRCGHADTSVLEAQLEVHLSSAELLVEVAERALALSVTRQELEGLLEDVKEEEQRVRDTCALIDKEFELASEHAEVYGALDPSYQAHSTVELGEEAKREARRAEKVNNSLPSGRGQLADSARARIHDVRRRAVGLEQVLKARQTSAD